MLSDTINKRTPAKRAKVLLSFLVIQSNIAATPIDARVIAYPLTGMVNAPNLELNKLMVPRK